MLVLGMHRSGTSAAAGMLARLGAELGEELLPPTEDNPKGFFENAKVVQTQEKLFAALGRTWHDPRALPADWREASATADALQELSAIVNALWDRATVVAVKDPRSCRTVPVWLDVARDAGAMPGAVIMVRHPDEVAESLHRRDELSRLRAHLVWMRYLLDAERETRGIRRLFVAYEEMLDDWRTQVERIGAALQVPLAPVSAETMDGFLDKSLRNHQASRIHEPETPIASLAIELHGLLMRSITEADTVASEEFDAVASRFDVLAAPYLAALEDSLALELPLKLNEALQRHGIEKGRIDAAVRLAALSELWRPAMLPSEPGDCAAYYRDGNSEFTEARVVSTTPERVDDHLRATFDLPPSVRPEYMRIDPDNAAGTFTVLSLSIQGEALADLSARIDRVSEVALPVTSAGEAVRFAAIGEDPHFEIDMRGVWAAAAPDAPARVELRFRKDTVASEIGGQTRQQQQDISLRIEALRAEQHAQFESGQEQRLDLIESSRVRHEAVTAELAAVRHELEVGLQQRLALLDASRIRHEATAAELTAMRQVFGLQQESVAAEIAVIRHQLEAGHHQSLAEAEAARALRNHLSGLTEELQSLRGQQTLLLEWAKRRSPRYWWQRLLGTDSSKASVRPNGLELRALENLRLVAQPDGGSLWCAQTDDPQFLLGSEGLALPGGWYLLQARFSRVDGHLRMPCLYPDYGNGVQESERIPLPDPGDDGLVAAVVLFKATVCRLRFDPSIRAANFALGEIALRRLGRVEALARMATGIRSAVGSWSGAMRVMLPVARAVMAARSRRAGELAYSTYVETRRASVDQYAAWVRSFDTLSSDDVRRMRTDAECIPNPPLISILMPVYQTPERWLRRCIDSVLEQAYPHWELCIADDASPSPHVRRVLNEYMERDARIRVVFRETNGHISAASNSALELAQGSYVALLDHDDELPASALFEVAKAIQSHPEWRVIYSDEDKIDEKGRRFDPYFKPDWNYELFLAQNCICHLGVYDAQLIEEVGGFRAGLEGSQDWDLALRCVEQVKSHEIGHIAKILYHWRAIPGSTAMGVAQKDYARNAGWRAVTDHLTRLGVNARVEVAGTGYMNVRRQVPAPTPKVSLIIPTRDKVDLLRTCVQSILDKTDYSDFEILIVDNQSEEHATLRYFEELGAEARVRVLHYDQPFNYSAINNFAAGAASGSIIGLVNNDIEVISPDWMQEMVSQAIRPEIGAVGVMLLYPNDTIQHAGVILGVGGVAGHPYVGQSAEFEGVCGRARLAQEMSAVTAACLFVRKPVFDQVGGLDEKLSVAFNDIDFCLRVRAAGYRNLWTPYVRLYHHESASRGYEDTPEKLARFNREVDFMRARWGDSLRWDPAYNPNLSLDSCDFDLAFPPRYNSARSSSRVGHALAFQPLLPP